MTIVNKILLFRCFDEAYLSVITSFSFSTPKYRPLKNTAFSSLDTKTERANETAVYVLESLEADF